MPQPALADGSSSIKATTTLIMVELPLRRRKSQQRRVAAGSEKVHGLRLKEDLALSRACRLAHTLRIKNGIKMYDLGP